MGGGGGGGGGWGGGGGGGAPKLLTGGRLDPATAEKVLRLAAKTTHPAVSAVFEDGRLSLDQAAVAVTAPAHVDEMMAELAPLSTVAPTPFATHATGCSETADAT